MALLRSPSTGPAGSRNPLVARFADGYSPLVLFHPRAGRASWTGPQDRTEFLGYTGWRSSSVLTLDGTVRPVACATEGRKTSCHAVLAPVRRAVCSDGR